jgi:hypothetical protein
MRGPGKFSRENDWVVPVPKGETVSNKHARLRHTAVSRSGVEIARIVEAQRERKARRKFDE